jgi:ABC-type bacteriocin/lantibiotic exporter with double-glycine peptidase domain
MNIKQLFLGFLAQEKEMRDDFKSVITKVYNFTQNNMNLCGKILGGYPALIILAMFGIFMLLFQVYMLLMAFIIFPIIVILSWIIDFVGKMTLWSKIKKLFVKGENE